MHYKGATMHINHNKHETADNFLEILEPYK